MPDVPTHQIEIPAFRRLGTGNPASRRLKVPSTISTVPELPVIRHLADLVRDGGTFVDVGAHAGSYTIALADKFDQVLSFEPSRMQRSLLEQNIRLNGLVNCRPHNEAVGAVNGAATLHVMGRSGGSNTLASPTVTMPSMEEYEVPVITLDGLQLTDLRLLKVDVEGWELEVLKGGTESIRECRPVILIEVWEEHTRRVAVGNLMCQLGYEVRYEFAEFPELALCLPRGASQMDQRGH